MPLFDIANAHPCIIQYPLCSERVKITSSSSLSSSCHGKPSSVSLAFGIGRCVPCAWKSLDKLKMVKFNVGRCSRLVVVNAAVAATLEPTQNLAPKGDEWLGSKALMESSNGCSNEDDSEELDEKEKVRRMRISKANKGATPWNKGRKHSAETLRKIKERTRLAMQNPKVKMKLANLSHPQTEETRQKISAGVRMIWEKKREKQVAQETCCIEWQNLIAEASRQGYTGQEELQWNSYETLEEQLKQEWSESIEERKLIPRIPGNRRAPKTPEQRRKIAEAIYAKWSDPEYRRKVCSAMTKNHGTEGSERKPRTRSSDGAQSTRRKPTIRKYTDTNISVRSDINVLKQVQLKKSKYPVYKDPLVSSKLEMIKSIRAQRAGGETKQANAIEQARLLIAEAENAAKALEVAAMKSPIAQASLIETRKLIAEAIQSLESIDPQGMIAARNVPSVPLTQTNQENDAEVEVLNKPLTVPINGHRAISSIDYKFGNNISEFSSQMLVNGGSEPHLTSSINGYASYHVGFNRKIEETSSSYQQNVTEHDHSNELKRDPSQTEYIRDGTQAASSIVTRKWVRGRLVEVVE